MRTRLSFLPCTFLTIATVVAQSGPPAQDPPDAVPVFRAGANLVRVDMYATQDGRLITDLKRQDVEVYEDNVKQTIETFEFVRVGPSAAPSATKDDSRARVFIVFIDTNTARLDGDAELKQALLRFLDKTAQPNDLVGLMTPDMQAVDVKLGRRAAVISDIANDQRWIQRQNPEREDPKEFAWENCYSTGRRVSRRVTEMKARWDSKETIDALRELVERLRDLREERKAVLLVTGGWPFADEGSLATGSENETRSCEDDRKALIRINYNNMLKDLARSANRSNVSFYPVSTRRAPNVSRELPVSVRNDIAMRERRATELVSGQFKILSEETDGMSELQLRNLDKVTTRIIDDTSAYYLLGYQSTNQRADSKFRSISVKVRRPEVVVRARPGYGGDNVRIVKVAVDPDARPPVDGRITAAFSGMQRFEIESPVWAKASAFRASTTENGAFWLVGQMALKDGKWDGSIAEVVVTATDRRQVFTKNLDVKSRSDTFGIRVPEAGTLPPGQYSIRVRLRREDDTQPLVIDLPRVEIGQAATGLGEPVLWRRGPAVRNQFQQTADPRFRRNERLRVELATDVADAPVARVLDRMGQPLQVPIEVSERAGDEGTRWLIADLPLAGLAPGEYAVSVTQRDRVQVAAFRLVP